MISVLNHLQRLNGNRIIAVLIISFLISSCGGTDQAVRRSSNSRGTKTKSQTKVTDVKKKDRVKKVEWTEGRDEKKPPITNEDTAVKRPEVITEDVYDVTYFIPFDANDYLNSAQKSDRFIQYYCGMLVATNILEREGISLNINVVDEKKRRFETILREEVNGETDVIVGPYSRSALKNAVKYAKSKEIPLVSPWQASSRIAEKNPYYVQLRPNLDEHYYSIFEDVKKNFDVKNVHLVGRQTNTKDVKRIKKLQRMAKDVWGESEEDILMEQLLNQDSINVGETAFDSLFTDVEEDLVFIIPNWSFEDESFIYGALRRLSVEKGLTRVVVYGMPIMMESEKVNFDYYSSLNMRVARSKFVDERDYDVTRFKRDFVNKYGALPTDDAYEGYDNLMFIGRNLNKYGKNFQYYLNEDQGYYLQAGYRVEETRKDTDSDKMGEIDYFENKNVEIIEFMDNRFVRNLD